MRDTVGAAVGHTILETGANSARRFMLHLRVTNRVKFQSSTPRWQSASKMGVGYHSVQPIAPPTLFMLSYLSLLFATRRIECFLTTISLP